MNRRLNPMWSRQYRIAEITIQVNADLPITETTFHARFKPFEVSDRGGDTIVIQHHFSPYALWEIRPEDEIYRKPPWRIFKTDHSWIYVSDPGNGFWAGFRKHWGRLPAFLRTRSFKSAGNGSEIASKDPVMTAPPSILSEFSPDYNRAHIYHNTTRTFRNGNLHSLTLFPTDQILLAQILAERQGCFIHAGGVIFNGKGLLFVGHSAAGKSTLLSMFGDRAEILCDDRIIVRKWPDGFRIHGSWSHGELTQVSPGSSPLAAVFFLKQHRENRILPIIDRRKSVKSILACLIKPHVTTGWWKEMLALVDALVREVPCYTLYFNKSGRVVNLLKQL